MSEGKLPELDAPSAPPLLPTRRDWFVLRALQIGAVAAVLVVTTYKVFDLDRFFVPKELALHLTAFVAGMAALGSLRRLRLSRVDALLGGFLVISLFGAVLAQNHWAAARALAISVSGVVLFEAARTVRRAGLSRQLIGGLALAVALAAATSLLQAYGLQTEWFTLNRSPGGTLGNRNFIGHIVALGLPLILLHALWTPRRWSFWLGALGVAAASGALVLTRSRAAWLGVMAALAVLLIGVALSRAIRTRQVAVRGGLLLLLTAAGVAAALLLPNSLRWASDAPYLETAKGVVNYREGSGKGRLVQYETSAKLAVTHPPFGVGPGNWAVVYPEVAGRGDPSLSRSEAGVTSNPWPSSDWVAMVAERGLLGVLLLALAFADLAGGAFRLLRAPASAEDALGSAALMAAIAGVVVAGLFDAVLLLAWPTLLFFTAAGALWAPPESEGRAGSSLWWWSVLVVLVFASGAAAARSAGSVAAMSFYAADDSRERLELAAKLDPGNYRVQLRLAQRSRRSREQRCRYAKAAHELYPQAAAAERLARRCK